MPPAIASLLDVSCPSSCYPAARSSPRTIIAHIGPTNSGKTRAALQRLAASHSGVYCGPLRMLAWEAYETLASVHALKCNLVTGQERQQQHGARHTACTVEMADVDVPVACCVVDEGQMLASAQRGWAWTRVLLGMRCKQLHVCGEARMLPALQLMAAACGDTIEVVRYAIPFHQCIFATLWLAVTSA
jgi:ATP-dependent RNA helicase SUPV3L1/SUV3